MPKTLPRAPTVRTIRGNRYSFGMRISILICMATSTIRLRPETREALKEIAAATGSTLQDALATAVAEHRRRVYLEGLNADYANLRKDPEGWADFQEENAVWDVTNEDGLDGS